MKRFITYLIVATIALLVGFIVGWILANSVSATRLERVVAMSWGDGKYGSAFYGAHVFLEPRKSGYSVRARVHIGRGNDYFHDCGELGTVQTDAEAVARWGKIEWREDGLHIGNGTNHYFLARAEMESHR
jgi:hypothetical protein